MVIADLQMEDKGSRPRFFQETFLVADTKFEMILEMSFLKIDNANVAFDKKTLIWKSYTTNKALPTTKQVQLVNPKKFVITALDADSKTFVVHVAIREQEKMLVHSKRQVPTEVPAKYFDYSNIFSAENIVEFPEYTGINNHAIKLEEGKQPSFRPIFSLGPVELETLKTYIKTNLANSFIRPSKSPARIPIFFEQKQDRNFRLCVDYWGFNNIIIKNQYSLLLIGKSLDWLDWARRFIQFNLTNAYHRMRIHESNKWKTVFWTKYGHFKYQVMLFGLSNTPATFQGYVNKILVKKLNIFIIVYLNDILIYTNPGKLHIEAMRWVLNKLRKYSFFANLKKCRFHQDKICFLGYVVSSKGISMEGEQIKVIKK